MTPPKLPELVTAVKLYAGNSARPENWNILATLVTAAVLLNVGATFKRVQAENMLLILVTLPVFHDPPAVMRRQFENIPFMAVTPVVLSAGAAINDRQSANMLASCALLNAQL